MKKQTIFTIESKQDLIEIAGKSFKKSKQHFKKDLSTNFFSDNFIVKNKLGEIFFIEYYAICTNSIDIKNIQNNIDHTLRIFRQGGIEEAYIKNESQFYDFILDYIAF